MAGLAARIKAFGERNAKIKWVLPPYLILAVMIPLGITSFKQQASDEVAQNAKQDAVTEHVDCVRRVETRDDLRGVLFAILALYPADEPQVVAIQTRIDETYPALTIDDCPPLPE